LVLGVTCGFISFASSKRGVAQESAEVKVVGTLVVEDEKGAEVDDESGSAIVNVRTRSNGGWSGRPTKVFVIEGHFELSLPQSAQVGFDAFNLENGRAYWLTGDEKDDGRSKGMREGIAIPPDHKLEVRARYAPPFRLKVVDAATGGDLSNVDVLLDVYHDEDRSSMLSRHWLGRQQLHPTPWWSSDFRARSVKSPLPLEVNTEETFIRWSESYWVHAPGFAWGSIDVDFRKGGEQTVKLAHAGAMVVTVTGAAVPERARIHLRKAKGVAPDSPVPQAVESASGADLSDLLGDRDDALVEWWPVVAGKATRLEGIPFGSYRVTVDVGERFRGHVSLAETTVEVTPDHPGTATLTLSKVPVAPEPQPISIELRIDPGWGTTDFELALAPERTSPLIKQKYLRFDRSAMVARADPPGTFDLPQTNVAPGIYDLSLDPFGIGQTLVVSPDLKPLVIEVGPPVDVTIHFVDAKSKAPLEVERPTWFVAKESPGQDPELEGLRGFHPHSFRDDTKPSDALEARVPAGRIGFRGNAEDHDSFRPVFLVVDDAHRTFEVALVHLTGIRVHFRIDGKQAAWKDVIVEKEMSDDYWSVELHRKDGRNPEEELESGEGPSRGGRYYTVRSVGAYSVTFPPIDGFEPVAPMDVTIADQELTDVAVDLVRKKK
jgi:hypothetical protein